MTSEPPAAAFFRELPGHVTVAVDGVYGNELYPDDDIRDARSIGRVVLAMPDFYADALAHVLTVAGRIADALGVETWVDETERALAETLFEVAASAGYRCPTGGRRLPHQSDDRQVR